ncbi:MAG: nitrate reductase [Desulfobacteraceae bacterium]|nr:MAG: nitrate reductase [Desulfobacteraceae bacterium]
MSVKSSRTMSRRGFIKCSGAFALAAALAARAPVLHALVPLDKSEHKDQTKKVLSVCDMCINRCSLIAKVQNGIVTKLDPNPDYPKSRGMLCAKGNAGIKQLYDPDRLKVPLLRKGERGEGRWERLTWDQALDHAAEQLTKIGEKYTRCGVLFMAGADDQEWFVQRFADAYGSLNLVTVQSNCLLSRNRAYLDTFGTVPIPDVLNCKYLVVSGANPLEALITPDSMDLVEATRKGCRLVVLDPRFTRTSAFAHEWYPIRPGTDMAFFLAVAHVLIEEKLYDEDFVSKRTVGIEQLTNHVKPYSPEWAEKECDISANAIRSVAKGLAEASPAAMIYPGRRTSDYTDSTQIRRAMAIVNALLGNWDRRGGLTPPKKNGLSFPSYDPPEYENNRSERADVERSLMMFEEQGSFKDSRDAVIEGKPYPVKGLFTYKMNPLQSGADRRKTIEMIRRLDFMLTVDITMSDTAWMADLVLPAVSYLERQDPVREIQCGSAHSGLVARDPVVPPLFEAKSLFWIVTELSKRMGFGDYFNFTMDQYRKLQLKNLPHAMQAIREKGFYALDPGQVYGLHEGKDFKTPSKKVELYSEAYKEIGIDPMPVYSSRKVPKDSFRLVVGRNAFQTQCTTTNNSLLSQLMPENELWIHPKSADTLGITHGDSVEVSSRVGKGRLKAHLTEEIREDTVYMASGFGALSKGLSRIYGKGACISEVLEDRKDAITGNMAMHETLVTVKRVSTDQGA